MPNTYTQLYYHAVFSTKYRKPSITPHLEERLYPYLNGIARGIGCTLIIGNGIEDHVHLLLRAPARLSVSSILKSLKGDSSRWVHETFASLKNFEWQVGYGAFSVSTSGVGNVKRYISNQKPHHGRKTFKQEFVGLLEKHGVEYDERYLWD